MTDDERDTWAASVLERIRLHRRREVSGLLSMLDDGLADIFDVLAVAPLLLNEHQASAELQNFERRRLERLRDYRPDWKRIKKESPLAGGGGNRR